MKPMPYTHEYCYDDNNNLILTSTTDGGGIWDRDQRNFYRQDGYLARTEIGQYLIQGMDYTYTVQGWNKGTNSGTILPDRDIGNDGANTSGDNYNKLHRWIARDAFGFSLYYNSSDYSSIETFALANRFYTDLPSTNGVYYDAFEGMVAGLYDGNVTAMQTALTGANGVKMDYLLKGYFYDQLLRLKNAYTATEPATGGASNTVFTANYWEEDNDSTEDYLVNLGYDRMGNIRTLERRGTQAIGTDQMDNLTYHYQENPIGLVHNQLRYVSDVVKLRQLPQ